MSDLLLLTTHAIQYQAPLFRYLSEQVGVDLHVAFLETPAVEQPYWDAEFGRHIQWDIPLTEGYKWSVLPSGSLIQRLSAFVHLHSSCEKPPILLMGWSTPLHWAVWTWAILSRIPVLLVAETNRASYSLRPRPQWRHQWLKILIQYTAGLLYIGQRNRDFYMWMGASASRLFSYPYSIDNQRFAEAQRQGLEQRGATLTSLNLDPALPTLLFCGKLIEKKRPDLLLEAVCHGGLEREVNILYVGEGQLRTELMSRAAERDLKVAFTGFLNQSLVPMAYAVGDILCLLSDTPSETWGLVVNESLACGRPVIVSESCGCVPDLVADRGTGWVVSSGSLTATSQTLQRAVKQLPYWPRMGERGQDLVANHTFAKMAEGVIAALRSIDAF